jgi:hypothetical protein
MPKVRASVEGLERIVDVSEFRRRLEEIEKSNALNREHKESVLIFLEAWRKRETGDGTVELTWQMVNRGGLLYID